MSELRKSCVYVIVWILCQYECQAGRTCVNDDLAVSSMQLHLKYEEKLEGTPENFSLYSIVSWTLTSGNHSDFDGYLVQLMNPTARTEKYLTPSDDCQASNEKLWIKSQNESICDVENDTRNDCNTFQTSSSDIFLACGRKSSAAKDGVTFCSGSSLRLHKRMGFFSIPNTRESVKYQIEFNTNYQFRIVPYQRQWMKRSIIDIDILANWFCADVIASTFNVHSIDARKKCCESNVVSLAPYGLNVSEPILDRNTRTLNVTISWIPPTLQESLIDLSMKLTASGYPEQKPQITNFITSGSVSNETGCPTDDRMQSLTAYNLLPNASYKFVIASHFNGDFAKTCGRGVCGLAERIRIDDINPCDEKWNVCDVGTKCIVEEKMGNDTLVPETSCHPIENSVNKNQSQTCETVPDYCDDQATCSSPNNGSADLEIMCSCSLGHFGDGIRKKYNGSGCTGCPIFYTCDPVAKCEQLQPPQTGFHCQCDEHHYGDGLKSGTGCSSRAKRTVSIVVPVVIAVIIIIILITWYMVIRGKKKNTQGL